MEAVGRSSFLNTHEALAIDASVPVIVATPRIAPRRIDARS
jgi:hypothetical protein